jgi:hypothetical protein
MLITYAISKNLELQVTGPSGEEVNNVHSVGRSCAIMCTVLAVPVRLREFEFQKIFDDFYTFLYFISVYILGVFIKCVSLLFCEQYLCSSPLDTRNSQRFRKPEG